MFDELVWLPLTTGRISDEEWRIQNQVDKTLVSVTFRNFLVTTPGSKPPLTAIH